MRQGGEGSHRCMTLFSTLWVIGAYSLGGVTLENGIKHASDRAGLSTSNLVSAIDRVVYIYENFWPSSYGINF